MISPMLYRTGKSRQHRARWSDVNRTAVRPSRATVTNRGQARVKRAILPAAILEPIELLAHLSKSGALDKLSSNNRIWLTSFLGTTFIFLLQLFL